MHCRLRCIELFVQGSDSCHVIRITVGVSVASNVNPRGFSISVRIRARKFCELLLHPPHTTTTRGSECTEVKLFGFLDAQHSAMHLGCTQVHVFEVI